MSEKASSDGVGIPAAMRAALEGQLAEPLRTGTPVSVGRIVETLQVEHPNAEISALELAEAVLREASSRGIAILIG